MEFIQSHGTRIRICALTIPFVRKQQSSREKNLLIFLQTFIIVLNTIIESKGKIRTILGSKFENEAN